ncbi:X-Pro dipeptidyl-peptidase [Pyrenophora seminiperda CCB06]|uniref:X-Pro dipeptidyl-peptidase n=1 Tax=Pyrenophora seminiperda CCB06 TaxID=1302712 RepID=A0A3M7M010_9PLEO|nr:X-Pro dipeptidyl-peptidase [Pyrenophora seminiperda CCB06]
MVINLSSGGTSDRQYGGRNKPIGLPDMETVSYIMSVSVRSKTVPPDDEPIQIEPLRAVVETYVLNDLDINTHPSYSTIQQEAWALSGRPVPVLSVESPKPFVNSVAVSDATDDDTEDSTLSLEDFYRDMGEESRRLTQAMEDYEKVANRDGKKKSVLSKDLHTWSEVLQEVENASNQYNEPDGIWGKIRKAFRKSADKADIASAWLILLPNQSEYFSILCGGLKLIIGAASRLKGVRDEIAKFLMEIPNILSCANRAQNVFKRSKALHQASASLFVATISVLEHVLVYFKEKSLKKAIKVLVQQKDYEQRLTDAIEMLGARSLQFDRVARTCGLEEIHYTSTQVQAVRTDVRRLNTEVHQHMNLAREESYAQTQNLEYRIKHHMDHLFQSFVKSIASDPKLDPKTQNLRLPILPLKKSRSAPELRRRRNVIEQVLLNLLEYDAAVTESDVQKSLRYVYRLPKPAQDRIIAMIRHHKFQTWMADHGSSALFLNGHYNASGSMRQCPTSFVSARLASALQSDRDTEEEPSLHPPRECVFKLLFTCPRVSRRYSGRFDGASVLTMPEKVAAQGAFTMAKWDGYTSVGAQ